MALVEAVMVQDFLWIRFCVWHQEFDLFGFSRLSLCSPLQAETSTGRSRDETTRCPPASSTSQVLSSISSSTLQSASPPSVHPPVRFICQSVYLSVSLLLSIHSFCPSDGQMINPSSIHPSTHLPICPTVTPSINPLSLCVSLSEEEGEDVLTKKEKEERRIAEMGRPTLGEYVKLEVVIEESYEFKVRSDCVSL